MKIGVISLGCAKNLVNTEQMMFLLSEAGYVVSGETSNSNIIILNTCGFIDSAKSEAIEHIIELVELKKNRETDKIIVAGCLSQRYKEEVLKEFPEIDAIVGTGAFEDIVDIVKNIYSKEEEKKIEFYGDINAPISETKRIITTSPSWAYLKIAEGCDNNCAYCVIPSIRGRFRSRPLEKIVNEARDLAKRGVKELIIVAQDVTMYGVDIYKSRMLTKLLGELCEIEELQWIRLHYLYPNEIDDNLIDFISRHDKILKYLDIPIQHINDEILRNMNRRGTAKEIKALIEKLREKIPDVVLRTSIITGLPGESEKEFHQLCDFLVEAKIERAGIFPYSPEEGSKAAQMDRPDTDVAINRAEMLRELQAHIMDTHDLSRIGSVVPVLIEGRDEDGVYYGRSFAESPDVDGYIFVSGSSIRVHEFSMVCITEVHDGQVRGITV